MSEKSKKQKKGTISEEDVSTILQRYTATTILTLLQEVAQVQDSKLDWNSLVKRTTTGITNPREYQMLWRHLAYRDEFTEKLEDEAKPMDDDSDLEYELEAFPPVNNEASTEAAACVKVLIASGSRCDSGLEKGLTIEAPLTINIPDNKKSTQNSSENIRPTTNITVPVSVQRQPQTVVASSTEELDKNNNNSNNNNNNLAPRRKRKPWSAAEDKELFAAVQKCGEGNWANILKGDFKGDRTASQLSQRWNIIKKRNTNNNNNNNNNSNVKTGSQLSEVHLAARRALNMALDPPGMDNLKASSSLGRTKSSMTALTTMRPIVPDPTTSLPQDKPSELTKQFPKIQPPNGPDPIKAAAVAAGARIATQSAAAAILKQQLKSAIHIKTGVTNFRELHSPRLQDHNANVGPVLNPVSTGAQETNVGVAVAVAVASSAKSPKNVEQDQAVAAVTTKVEISQEKEVKECENATLTSGEDVIMETCENESTKQEK